VGALHSFLVPYPGTQIHQEVEELGLLLDLPLHQLHHKNRNLRFTANISQEEFEELNERIDDTFSRYNLKIRYALLFRAPGFFFLNLAQRGLMNPTAIWGMMKTILLFFRKKSPGPSFHQNPLSESKDIGMVKH
jgi:hypothetical protein